MPVSTAGKRRTFVEKHEWIASTARNEGDECVDWPWSVAADGYPQAWDGVRVRKVTHLVLEASGRPRPEGQLALHSCDRPRCVSPQHLRWGTQSENLAEMYSRHRRVIDQARDLEGRYALMS